MTPSVRGQKVIETAAMTDDTGVFAVDDIGQYTEAGRTEKESTPLSMIKIFPNPTSDILTIVGTEKEDRLDIFDAIGRHVLETKEKVLDLFHFPAGIYFLSVEKQIFKIVKQ